MGGRTLRAVRRPPAAARMLDDGDVAAGGGYLLRIREEDGPARPLLLVRLGSKDVKAAHRAIAAGSIPTAITVGLGELKQTVTAVRAIANNLEVPWGSDPLLYKTALAGYRTATSLQALDYTPGRDADPYLTAELEDDRLLRQIVRKSVGHQYDMGAGFVFAADFYIAGPDDAMFAVSQRSRRISMDARDAFGERPLIAPVRVDLRAFRDPASQALLVRALADRRPDGYLLHLNGLHEDSSVESIVDALRLMLALQSVGADVILARPGDLRHVAAAAGIRGVESGLGRLLRFALPDYSKGSGGPGPVPARFEFPTLVASLSGAATRVALEAGRLSECDCQCPSCAGRATVAERMAAGPEHNLHQMVAWSGSQVGLLPTARCEQLDSRLARAVWLWRGVKHPSAKRGLKRSAKWRAVLEELDGRGLLLPDAAADALGLTG